MGLKIYNTAARAKEEFAPLEPGRVRMYVCGVTVYDYCHLGHGRCYTAFDLIHRYLKYLGYDVLYIQNITDVDDKLIRKAALEPGGGEVKAKVAALAERYTRAFFEDMDRLNILRASEYPRATEHIGEMQGIIAALLEKGYAYRRGANVWFEIGRFDRYGELSRRNLDDLRAGARVEIEEEKKSPLDFALWKASGPGEPSWPSPWGDGRPGWHIECSAMSTRYLGMPFDIHGGGQDLIFPHHENEKAQSEAAAGGALARYWIHNGFVTINREKMSKSLGNVFNLRDLFARYDPRAIRYFFLSQHYRSPVDFSEDGLKEAVAALRRLDDAYGQAAADLEGASPDPEVLAAFETAMNDDFNSAAALAEAHRVVNEFHQGNRDSSRMAALAVIASTLGIELKNPHHRLDAEAPSGPVDVEELLGRERLDERDIRALAGARKRLRENRQWAEADRIRDRFRELGIEVRDNPDGTTAVIYY